MEKKTILKAVAALEVIKKIQLIKAVAVVGIAIIFLNVLFDNFVLISGLSLIVYGWFLFTSIKEENELKEKYGV
jgi:hypothetical protein